MKKYLVLALISMLFACSEANKEETTTGEAAQTQNSTKVEQATDPQMQDVVWEEGKHFVILDHDASARPEIKEFFSFYCPHCFNFEPFVAEIKRKFGNSVPVDKVHVDFMGGVSKDMQRQLSAAMIFARQLDKEAQINQAIFNHIHNERKRLDTQGQLIDLLTANGISEAEFSAALTQPDLVLLLDANAKKLAQYQNDVSSVPTFVVNGKYKVLFGQNLNAEQLLSLIEWLSNKA